MVVHCKRKRFDVYIGRPSKWGNPFTHLSGGEGNSTPYRHSRRGSLAKVVVANREEAIRHYREWIVTQPELMAALPELRGKVLGCWCAPLACHGDVLVELANG